MSAPGRCSSPRSRSLLGVDLGWPATVVAPVIALSALPRTGVLLVWDLKRPERFSTSSLRSNSRLLAGARRATACCVVRSGGDGLVSSSRRSLDAEAALHVLAWLAIRGRGAWSPATPRSCSPRPRAATCGSRRLLFPHLLVQAVMVGAGALAVVAAVAGRRRRRHRARRPRRSLVAAVLHLADARGSSPGGRHDSPQRSRGGAHHHSRPLRPAVLGRRGRARRARRGSWPSPAGVATRPSAGRRRRARSSRPALLAYETVYVRAGQDVPLS